MCTMGRSLGTGIRLSGFKFQLCQLCAAYLIFSCLKFFICKIRIGIVVTSQVIVGRRVNKYKAVTTVSGMEAANEGQCCYCPGGSCSSPQIAPELLEGWVATSLIVVSATLNPGCRAETNNYLLTKRTSISHISR